jgi:two-component system nitrogen regulation sensor histidine kinase NtrY
MKLRIKYFLYIGLVHTVLLTLIIIYLRDNSFLFIAAELGLLISLGFGWHIYKSFILPVQLMAAGAESLKDKDFSLQFKPVGQKELDTLISVYNLMIEQLRLERTYQTEQHFLLEKLIQASPAGILLLDFDGNIHSLNKAAEHILGKVGKELKGQSMQKLELPFIQELNALRLDESRVLQSGGTRFYRVSKSGFIDRGFERQFILLEELTQEILRAEKGAYDKVIRMMSHEVNNSIGAVNSILQSLEQVNSIEADFKDAISVAIGRNLRLSKFMGNFAEVVKIPTPRKQYLKVQDLLESMLRLMEFQADKKGVQLRTCLAAEAIWADMDKEQMEQVLVNVLKNALEAAPVGGHVRLELEAGEMRVLNDGTGIREEVQKKLFTPFYSNKPQGQGIGLMLVREILRNHGYSFSLHTRPDGWTEFRIVWT